MLDEKDQKIADLEFELSVEAAEADSYQGEAEQFRATDAWLRALLSSHRDDAPNHCCAACLTAEQALAAGER